MMVKRRGKQKRQASSGKREAVVRKTKKSAPPSQAKRPKSAGPKKGTVRVKAVGSKPRAKAGPPTQTREQRQKKPLEGTGRHPVPQVVSTPSGTDQKTLTAPSEPEILHSPKAPGRSVPETQTPVATPPVKEPEKEVKPRTITVRLPITVKDLAEELSVKPSQVISKLIKIGIFANINQAVGLEAASQVAAEFARTLEASIEPEEARPGLLKEQAAKDKGGVSERVLRPPIVTLMGHVDHGKTSLLDAIRKTNAVSLEKGGMTQHIGAYEVFLEKGAVTFLDTPGHEAFTAMRARGAKVTDIVVLVVAADDGIMPQTEEAIDHALAAEAPILVAINKMDLPAANIDRVKKQLAEHGLTPEDWAGKTITVGVSAKTGQGIDNLLEMLLLEAELLELKANPKRAAKGVVIEASLSKGRGPVATVIIQDGTLRVSDVIICGRYYGRVRDMVNDRGRRLREALPAMPVEVSGLSGIPQAGDLLGVVEGETQARKLIEARTRPEGEKAFAGQAHVTLEGLYQEIKAGKISTLKLIMKADVQGSLEALKSTLFSIVHPELKLVIIHSGTGPITASDVMLAAASNAIVIGFHVGIALGVEPLIRQEEVDVKLYDIIYEVKSAIEKALEGLLEPETLEIFVGAAEVRQVFSVSKLGIVAGCRVTKGKITRTAVCKVIRKDKKILEGKIMGLKRFKDDARDVQEGYECGISIVGYQKIEVGDRIEAYEVSSQARTLKSA